MFYVLFYFIYLFLFFLTGEPNLDDGVLLSSYNGNIDATKYLISKGANCTTSLLWQSSVESVDTNILNLLLENKADPNMPDTTGNTAFHYFVQKKNLHFEILKVFLVYKASISTPNKQKQNSLHICCEKNIPENLLVLLSNNDDQSLLKTKDFYVRTPKKIAQNNSPDCYFLLTNIDNALFEKSYLFPFDLREKIFSFVVCHHIYSKTHKHLKIIKPILRKILYLSSKYFLKI